ncbi:hypothetical protein ACFW2Y_35685 [Streptomyces sp. NPDC058877]|uniref:hypothetical protein n=1 Tax=unclassified Streptomyces TaxID=2593676 RepID=UPI00369F9BB7
MKLANAFGQVSAVLGGAATVFAFVPGLQGVAAGLAAASLATGVAATAISAADAIWGTGDWKTVGINAVGVGLAVAGGGAGTLVGKAVGRASPKLGKAVGNGLASAIPDVKSVQAFTGMTGRAYSGGFQRAVSRAGKAAADLPGLTWGIGNTSW